MDRLGEIKKSFPVQRTLTGMRVDSVFATTPFHGYQAGSSIGFFTPLFNETSIYCQNVFFVDNSS